MHNLDQMRQARRYNAWLLDFVISAFSCSPLAQKDKNPLLLDFGAGQGLFTRALLAEGWRVQPLEPCPEYAPCFNGLPLPVLDTLQKIAPDSADGVFSLTVLEHIEDDTTALAEIFRVLRPGALAVLYVPAHPWLYSPMDAAVGHVRRYTRQDLLQKIEKAGFSLVKAGFADSLGYLASIGLRLGQRAPTETAIQAYDRLIFPLSQWLDRRLGYCVGKNLWVIAQKGAVA